MDSGTAMTLLKILSSDRYKSAVKGAAAGDRSTLSMLFNAAGLENPSDDDLNDLKTLAGLFGTTISDSNDNDNYHYQTDWSDKDTMEQLHKERNNARSLLTGSPKEIAIKIAAQAVGQLVRAGGDKAANDGNKLAAALMAANRTNSNKQNELYGPSKREAAVEAAGHEYMRRGNNAKIAADRFGDFIDKVLGTYQVADSTAGNAILTRELSKEGMSSGAFDQLGRSISASKNLTK